MCVLRKKNENYKSIFQLFFSRPANAVMTSYSIGLATDHRASHGDSPFFFYSIIYIKSSSIDIAFVLAAITGIKVEYLKKKVYLLRFTHYTTTSFGLARFILYTAFSVSQN